MEWVVLWLAFGIVAMIVASTKNRSGCGWFILGCCFGPFALVVAALPKLTQYGTAEDDASAMRKCPFCAELIKREAVKCRFCQSDVSSIPPERTGAEKLGFEIAKSLKPSDERDEKR